MDNSRNKSINIGITSIAVIFVVICLTIFAALTLSTASQEKKLADKYAASVESYWSADRSCTELANAIGKRWTDGADFCDIESIAEENNAEAWEESGSIYVSFNRPIDSENSLFVTLRLDEVFSVCRWQQMYTGQWENDTSLDVWTGE